MKRADYLLMLEEGYESITKWDTMGRLEYLSDHIFDFGKPPTTNLVT